MEIFSDSLQVLSGSSCVKLNLAEARSESTHHLREPNTNKGWLKSRFRLKSVVRKDQEGRERLIVLIPGRRNADVKFTSLRNCAKGVGKAMGSGNLVETFQV